MARQEGRRQEGRTSRVPESWLRYGYAAAAVIWALALPLATMVAAEPHPRAVAAILSALSYSVGGVICHQQAGRSFHLWGVQLPVCARCTGIYLGAAAASILFAAQFLRFRDDGVWPRAAVLASGVPVALTLLFEWASGSTPSNLVRAVSGLPLGAVVSWLVVQPLHRHDRFFPRAL